MNYNHTICVFIEQAAKRKQGNLSTSSARLYMAQLTDEASGSVSPQPAADSRYSVSL